MEMADLSPLLGDLDIKKADDDNNNNDVKLEPARTETRKVSNTNHDRANFRNSRSESTIGENSFSDTSIGSKINGSSTEIVRNTSADNANRLTSKREDSLPEDCNLQTSGSFNEKSNGDSDLLSQTTPPRNRTSSNRVHKTSISEGTARSKRGNDAKVELHGFVLVSWKIRQFSQLEKALRPGIIALQYKNDNTLESILQDAERVLDGRKVRNLAFIGHGLPGKLVVCHEHVLQARGSAADQNEIMEFFRDLVGMLMDRSDVNSRLDFLACPLSANNEGVQVLRSLEEYIKVPVTATKELTSGDVTGKSDPNSSISDLYLKSDQLRAWSGTSNQTISKFEKIRTVGKGSYGTATLYRKKDDDSLVVLKEINIHDLNATERLMAKNEVTVLSMLSHPNIISYYDSFEEEGTLWIEMEYADGGTLAQYLLKLDKEIDEQEILLMFQQMVSAIKYIHEHSILHRDLKTANIFLTKDGKVKLGDFGIAKIMSTRQDANTVLGTPYYISPEMCEGKPYNEKSDMWALGCILYEMANLQKTFEGTNLPALVNKIMKGSFAPVKEIFSVEFRVLVRDLLSKEPSLRPSAQELLIYRIPELLEKYDSQAGKDEFLSGSGARRSLLYYADVSTGMLYQIQGLPTKMQITEVSVGVSHVVVVSMERGIFSWGDNTYGQLGIGDQNERDTPTEVVALRGKSIFRASCGNNFTAFLSDNGLLLTCGQGDYGCLGHGNWDTLLKPKLNDDLLTRDVISVSCGRQHVAVAAADGSAFTWGIGDDGRLGLGDEMTRCTPTEVEFGEPVSVREVHCSADGTVFVMDTGVIFACGRNDCNKLRLNPRQGFLQQLKLSRGSKTVESLKTAILVKDLCKYQIAEVAFGTNHTAIMTEAGQVATMGSNNEGQLGYGHTKSRDMLTNVKGLEEEQIITISCGTTFTLAGTRTNVVYFWGSKPFRKSRLQSASDSISPSQSMNSGTRTSHSRKSSFGSFEDTGIGKSGSFAADNDTSGWKSDSEGRGVKRPESWKKSRSDSAKSMPDKMAHQGTSTDSVFDSEAEKVDERRQYVLRNMARKQQGGTNTDLLKMVDKQAQAVVLPTKIFEFAVISGIEGYDDCEEYPVYLQDIKCSADHVFLQLDTKAPAPKRRKRLSRKESSQKLMTKQSLEDSSSSVNSHGPDDLNSSEASGMDLTGSNVPAWIKDELEAGIPVDQGLDASSEESSSDTDSQSTVLKLGTKATIKRELSKQSERFGPNRRSSNLSILRHRELRNKIISNSSPTIGEADHQTETSIVDGVAITTDTSAFTANTLDSPPMTSRSGSVTEIEMSPPVHRANGRSGEEQNTDQKISKTSKADDSNELSKTSTSLNLSRVFPRPNSTPSTRDNGKPKEIGGVIKNGFTDSGVEFTPIESFASEPEVSEGKKTNADKGNNNRRSAVSNERQRTAKKKTHNRERSNEARSRGVARGRMGMNKGRGSYPHDRNAMRDEEAAKLCEQLKAMRDLHEQQEKHLETVKREALDSELRLKNQIEKLRNEKSEATKELYRAHEEQIRLADLKINSQQKESKKRENQLQNEVTTLKDELRTQSEKLQESFSMLITVQEQLLKLQQEQFKLQKQQIQETPPVSRSASMDRPLSSRSAQTRKRTQSNQKDNRAKSAVCSVM